MGDMGVTFEIAWPRAPSLKPMDPALKKFMDDLPKGDPDAQPPELLEVWSGFCSRRATGPANQRTLFDLGLWQGPPMPLAEIFFHVRSLKTGRVGSCCLQKGWQDQFGRPITHARPGNPMSLNVSFAPP
jgi:hypothetical protein